MKFLQVLGWATLAMALPSPAPLEDSVIAVEHLEKRATVTETIVGILNNLNATVTTDLAAANSAAVAIQNANSVQAIVSATAILRSNYQAIIQAITDATAAISDATGGGAGGIAALLVGLTQQEINQLTAAIQQIVALVTAIRASLTVTSTLGAAVNAAASSEIAALRTILVPFLAPLAVLVQAIATASATASLTVTGLQAAFAGLVTITRQLIAGV
ncbi:hypothetical protein PFICI_01737 [Pestalotiopsis fici W106-1]|uniref:Uncharacterized protein n=1 Tax=Pestalotiopsis fici (strain W106-1 / CGMCC3.15140) TaxID=1229662 RepID=W3XPK8_PESFW|nr:uncharacterized protein PFICI_01737 [Pestalotiopsis fici W106-1]ETS87909.1 hypothetical protein PFICI_01737 [Pestalotiopsis fici W106-1]